jgi:hypothetical protein
VSALCVLLAYALAQRLHPSPYVALLAATWVTIDPFLIYFATLFLSETLFTTLLLAGLLFWLEGMVRAQLKWVGAGGFLLSTAALCRSVLSPFLILFALCPLAFPGLPTLRRLQVTSTATLCIAVPLLAWCLFLHHVTGHWILISAQKGWNAYEGLNENFDTPEAITLWQQQMTQEAAARGLTDPVQRDAYFWQKTKNTIRAHPMAVAHLMLRKFFKFWRLWPYFPYTKAQRIISVTFMLPLLVLSLLGAFQTWIHEEFFGTKPRYLLGFILLYALVNTVTWTQIRYRIPLDPVLAVFAAIGCTFVMTKYFPSL